ncbi:MAG TPA: CDP-alcohol phosphatidyltransferase family protein, partial [Deinococcales bacterium]|nr:CDP-alcohol phosphatidyltransferase family protein [Deinococcales bacterium]
TASSRQEKPGRPREVLLAVVLPLIRAPVRLLVRLGVNPLWIVVVHAACAALAAWFIFLGPAWWPAAGVLLLIRMLLDNIDGAVARGSGSVTVAGRYLDTGLDLVTNFLLFLALTAVSGTVPALAAFVVLMFLLSYDHCTETFYAEVRDDSGTAAASGGPAPGPQAVLVPFRALYAAVLAPQDRLFRRLELRRFERLAGVPFASAPVPWQRAWFDRFSGAVTVNTGLSTQSTLLALLLFAGVPHVYVPLVLLQALLVAGLQVWRSRRFRNYVRVAVSGAA